MLVLPWTKSIQGKALLGKDMCVSVGEEEVKTLSSLPEVVFTGPQASGNSFTAVSWIPHSWLVHVVVCSVKDPYSFIQLHFT